MTTPVGAARRRLIVNADDFGQSPGVNEGVIRAHEHGIVTSASLMVRWPAAPAAAEYGRRHPALSVGLHLDLGEWTVRDGEWVALYQVVRVDDADAVAAEVARQVDTFVRMMGRGPTHIDSHQHVHLADPVRQAVTAVGMRLGVPVRSCSGEVVYSGAFYGQDRKGNPLDWAVGVDHLVQIVTGLPAGTTELGCHPGLHDDMPGMYVAPRRAEVAALCDPRVRSAIDAGHIELVAF